MAVGARQVGEFPTRRRMIKTPKNPADKATIVSIYPKQITEIKPTIQPSTFIIPAGSLKDPAVVTFGPSSWWKDFGENQPLTEIPVNAAQIASSIITDYCNGLLGCDMNNLMPGFFFIPGEKTKFEVETKYTKKLEEANRKQRNWFNILIRLADSLWSRSNNNPLVIWDEMRIAATEMGQDKPWMHTFQAAEMVKCNFCGNLRNPQYPICISCKAIDPTHPLAKDIKIAQ